jgi:hypothetical protein
MPEIVCVKGSRYEERHEIMIFALLGFEVYRSIYQKLRFLKYALGDSLITGTYKLEMQLAKLQVGWND